MSSPNSPTPLRAPAASRPYRTFTRPAEGRIVAGVGMGLSRHLGIDAHLIRLILALLGFLGGAGPIFYALLWVWTKQGPADQETTGHDGVTKSKRQDKRLLSKIGYVMLALVALVGSVVSFSVVVGCTVDTIIAFVVVGVGAFVVWTAYDRGLERLNTSTNTILIVVGACFMGIGLVIVAVNWQNRQVFGSTLVAIVLTLLGVAALGVPLWLRMWDALIKERADSAAAAEREEIAARLHDSVLQTLALIQKRSDNPGEVTRLARSQERELRQWLFGSQDNMSGGAATVFAALELACGEVEDMFNIRISPVTVGTDIPLDNTAQAAVLAAREAMVNAAKHAKVSEVDVYAESLGGTLDMYVRDRGIGFNPDGVAADRHGLRESICGRIERAGGTVKVKTQEGKGTEIVISVPVGDE